MFLSLREMRHSRLRTAIRGHLEREQSALEAIRSRPVLEDPTTILAYQYDVVCNGVELSSGAVRIASRQARSVGSRSSASTGSTHGSCP